MNRLKNDFNGGETIDLGPYSEILSAALSMGFSTTDALEAALVCGTTDDIDLICDYLLLPDAEKKNAYQQAIFPENDMADEVYDQDYEYYQDYEEAPQKAINIQVQPPPAPNQLGTDIAYIDKQLSVVMNDLKIPGSARPAMLELPIANKLQLIQQHNRVKNPSAPVVTNVKHDEITDPRAKKAPEPMILGKNISAPVMNEGRGLPRLNTIPIKQQKSSPMLMGNVRVDSPSLQPVQPPLNPVKSAQLEGRPPKINAMVKNKSAPRSHNIHLNVKAKIKRDVSMRAVDEDAKNVDYGALDDEYEYYDEYEENYTPVPEQSAPVNDAYKPVKKVKKVQNVKVKLKKGSAVEVYSNSKGKWMTGHIIKIKKGLICVAYGPGEDTQKWLEATSKSFRPKLDNEEVQPPPLMNRKSIALQKKEPVKVKLRIGSAVEVFSVSNDRWIPGKLMQIKKGLIRVGYGKDFGTEKWLRANSKQFRPRLDKVDEALERKQDGQGSHDYSINNNDGSYGGQYLAHDLRKEQYRMDAQNSIRAVGTKRGDLKIKIHGALQLKSNGNFAQITLADHTLKTKKVATDQNPVWKEILRFSNFRPQIGKTAVIAVGNKNMLRETIVASAEFELPIVFSRQEKMTIDLADSKKRLSGIVVLEQVVVDSGK
eukprot:523513_1